MDQNREMECWKIKKGLRLKCLRNLLATTEARGTTGIKAMIVHSEAAKNFRVKIAYPREGESIVVYLGDEMMRFEERGWIGIF